MTFAITAILFVATVAVLAWLDDRRARRDMAAINATLDRLMAYYSATPAPKRVRCEQCQGHGDDDYAHRCRMCDGRGWFPKDTDQ